MRTDAGVLIVGAGPYGLSIAAHVRAANLSFRIFGTPMQTWQQHMPEGMLLKSDGFASNLSEPAGTFTLRNFCTSSSLPYHDTNLPVPLETFVKYGLDFQRQCVPGLDSRSVEKIELAPGGFTVTLADGEVLTARQVIVAVGITHFASMPPALAHLPEALSSHSSAHRDLATFKGRKVTVLGGGASAVDVAVLLQESGAEVNLIARRRRIRFHDPPSLKVRSRWQRLRHPATGLGPGLKSHFFCEAPGVFRHLPLKARLHAVEHHLGPAPGWPMRDRLIGKVPLDLGISGLEAQATSEGLRLTFMDAAGARREHLTSHLIAATGYRVDLSRLAFLDREIMEKINVENASPRLSAHFESSVPGLYFAGIAAAASFGPLMRFAFGAKYAARKITDNLGSAAAVQTRR